jgi:hypothetical protein
LTVFAALGTIRFSEIRWSEVPARDVTRGLVMVVEMLLANLPVTLLVEGGIFLTLAVGIRLSRRRKNS